MSYILGPRIWSPSASALSTVSPHLCWSTPWPPVENQRGFVVRVCRMKFMNGNHVCAPRIYNLAAQLIVQQLQDNGKFVGSGSLRRWSTVRGTSCLHSTAHHRTWRWWHHWHVSSGLGALWASGNLARNTAWIGRAERLGTLLAHCWSSFSRFISKSDF